MREEWKLGTRVVRLEKGDLTDMDFDAYVFYANHELQLGAGFGTAIGSRGGGSIQKELDAKIEADGLLKTGQAVPSASGRLKAKHIIHAVGPRFREVEMEAKLRATMESALAVADELGVERLGFPPMGTGFYGVPLELSARVMADTISKHLSGDKTPIKEVSVVVFDGREFNPFKKHMTAMA